MKHIQWKWHQYGRHSTYDCWQVVNLLTKRRVLTSTEEACLKIIELAYTLKTGADKPLNQKTLERKAKDLEGISVLKHQYWNWDGKTLNYNTSGF